MLYSEALIDELFQRIDTDAEVVAHVSFVDLQVALHRFNSFRNHRLIAYEEESAGRDFVEKSSHENCGGFHVDADRANFSKVFLERRVVFPDTAICSVDR